MKNGTAATKTAREMARYSSYSQISYRDAAGVRREGRVTAEAVKAAMLAGGTACRFTIYEARTATPYLIRWAQAVLILKNLRRGTYAH
jgi:hypothetical protein